MAFAILGFMVSCKSLPEPIPQQKNVRFEKQGKEDFFSPNFRKNLDSNYQISFVVRGPVEPISEIVSEELDLIDTPVLELENSLVRNYLRVIDRAVYYDLECSNEDLPYPFDYIVEIVKMEETRHYTGIVFNHDHHHFLTGKIMTVKIVDPKGGEIVALLSSEYVPCPNGCKIKYDNHKILDIEYFKDTKRSEMFERGQQMSEHFLTELCEALSYTILTEMNKKAGQ